MKRHVIYLLLVLLPLAVGAQTINALYAVGSAVPGGGPLELTAFPGNLYKFAGTLQEGELRIRNTEEHKASSYYLKPKYEDSYVINHGLAYTLVRDSTVSWVVPLSEDRYRFTVNTTAKTLTGELFTAWNELFIVGGATEIGWESYIMLPFTRERDELCTWTWTGELRNRPEHNEPRRFKFLGQNMWDPKALHPFTADEDVLKSRYLLTNGTGDNKWQTTHDGYYHIRVDVFRETVEATFLGTSPNDLGTTAVGQTDASPNDSPQYFTLDGIRRQHPTRGITLVRRGNQTIKVIK